MASKKSWIITGGAGYVGSHIAHEFLANDLEVVIFDSLINGLESRIEYLSKKFGHKVPLVVGDIRDEELFSKALKKYQPEGVIHTAGLKSVSESILKPAEYFAVNTLGTNNLLRLVVEHKVSTFIFSSSAAVYGAVDDGNSVNEHEVKKPISPYGQSKLNAESHVKDFLKFQENRGTSLRFFNVVGAESMELRDNSKENLIPTIMNKIKSGKTPTIYGDDYPTLDGTCVRDYVDVRDVAHAIYLITQQNSKLPNALNIGSGKGTTVKNIIDMINAKYGKEGSNYLVEERRLGDSPALCADISLMEKTLNFTPRIDLEKSIHDSLL